MAVIEKQMQSVKELVALLEDVKSSLRLFVKFGNAIKWIATVVLGASGITWAYRHFGSGI